MVVDERGDRLLGDLALVVATEVVEHPVHRVRVESLAQVEHLLLGVRLVESVGKLLVLDVVLLQLDVHLGEFLLQFLDSLGITEPVHTEGIFEDGCNALQGRVHLGVDRVRPHAGHARLDRGVDLVLDLGVHGFEKLRELLGGLLGLGLHAGVQPRPVVRLDLGCNAFGQRADLGFCKYLFKHHNVPYLIWLRYPMRDSRLKLRYPSESRLLL